jgi:hypothetical protein
MVVIPPEIQPFAWQQQLFFNCSVLYIAKIYEATPLLSSPNKFSRFTVDYYDRLLLMTPIAKHESKRLRRDIFKLGF